MNEPSEKGKNWILKISLSRQKSPWPYFSLYAIVISLKPGVRLPFLPFWLRFFSLLVDDVIVEKMGENELKLPGPTES